MHFFSKSSGNKTFSKIFIVYFILMLILYYSYVLLDHHRLNKSLYWLSKSRITEQDFDAIKQLGSWVSTFETLFLILFMVAVLTIHILFRKNIKVLTHFLLLNVALFVGMALINYIVFLVTSLPIGNLMQPLIIPSYILIVLFIYVLGLWIKKAPPLH